MFRGINVINLDIKGRLAIPARYRALLEKECEGQLIITIDTEQPCLLLYPLPEWELIEQKVNMLPSFNTAARRIQRLLIGHASEIEMDNSGRILLPPLLREYAQLDKEVMLVGQGKKFEIWSESEWKSKRASWLAEHTAQGEDMPAELQTLSL